MIYSITAHNKFTSVKLNLDPDVTTVLSPLLTFSVYYTSDTIKLDC